MIISLENNIWCMKMRFVDHFLLSKNNFKLKSNPFKVIDLVPFFRLAKDKQINFERF